MFRVCGDEAHRLRVIAMGQRDAGVGGAGQRGGDAGHDFVADAVRAQEFEFFAAAAKNESVATLQAHHTLAGAGVFEHERMDCFLRYMMMARCLADFDAFSVAAGEVEHFGADQTVVQDHVGFVEQTQAAQRQQAGVAGTGADQRDAAYG